MSVSLSGGDDAAYLASSAEIKEIKAREKDMAMDWHCGAFGRAESGRLASHCCKWCKKDVCIRRSCAAPYWLRERRPE
eukprot:scaffold20815_cov146-Isochrysis_galbana.AAC.2